jgi:hypothetical protein
MGWPRERDFAPGQHVVLEATGTTHASIDRVASSSRWPQYWFREIFAALPLLRHTGAEARYCDYSVVIPFLKPCTGNTVNPLPLRSARLGSRNRRVPVRANLTPKLV